MIHKQDHLFMGMCLDLARLAAGCTSPNPMVGAVIVRGGKVLATGFHRRAGAPHAEIEAIRKICRGNPLWLPKPKGGHGGPPLRGATLYINLEPCCHHGRTPPCTEAIIHSGIREVVVGMVDPDPKVAGQGIKTLRRVGIRVRRIQDPRCERLNESYLKHRRTGRPFVILKAAVTLDGKVAGPSGTACSGSTRQITGPEAQGYVHAMRDEVDAILVGKNTILKDNPRLTTRLSGGKGKDPIRIILDSHLSLPSRSKIFHVKSKAGTYIAVVHGTKPRKRVGTRRAVPLLFCRPNVQGQVDLKDLLRQLGRRGILSVLVEGGPTVHTSFLKEGLADKFYLFLAPRLMGEGVPLFPAGVRHASPLRNVTCRMVGSDVLISGYLG